MKTQIASSSRDIHAPASVVYEIIADYRTYHPLILPKPYFRSLEVEQGGVGAGTIVNFTLDTFGRIQHFRSRIDEPEPGRVLLETDLASGIVTRFEVSPSEDEQNTLVTITTELKNRGALEGWIAKAMLQKIYREELNLLAKFAESRAALAQSTAGTRAA